MNHRRCVFVVIFTFALRGKEEKLLAKYYIGMTCTLLINTVSLSPWPPPSALEVSFVVL